MTLVNNYPKVFFSIHSKETVHNWFTEQPDLPSDDVVIMAKRAALKLHLTLFRVPFSGEDNLTEKKKDRSARHGQL